MMHRLRTVRTEKRLLYNFKLTYHHIYQRVINSDKKNIFYGPAKYFKYYQDITLCYY